MSSVGQAQRLPLNSIFPTTMLANNSNIQRTAVTIHKIQTVKILNVSGNSKPRDEDFSWTKP